MAEISIVFSGWVESYKALTLILYISLDILPIAKARGFTLNFGKIKFTFLQSSIFEAVFKDKEWEYKDCGELHNRDNNAAKNIKELGNFLYIQGSELKSI